MVNVSSAQLRYPSLLKQCILMDENYHNGILSACTQALSAAAVKFPIYLQSLADYRKAECRNHCIPLVAESVCSIIASSSNRELKSRLLKIIEAGAPSTHPDTSCAKSSHASMCDSSSRTSTSGFTHALRQYCDDIHTQHEQKKIAALEETKKRKADREQAKKDREHKKLLLQKAREEQRRAKKVEKQKVQRNVSLFLVPSSLLCVILVVGKTIS